VDIQELLRTAGMPQRMVAQGPTLENARRQLVDSTSITSLHMTPQELNLYNHHINNLVGIGKVRNKNKSISTIRQMTVEMDGRSYNVPTVWDGKILSNRQAMERAAQVGWDKWPSYGSRAAAEQRYNQMHSVMEQDTARYIGKMK